MKAFQKYIKEEGLLQTVLAEKLNISNASLSDIVRGKRIPSLPMAALIHKLTKGRISFWDWLPSTKDTDEKCKDTKKKKNKKHNAD